ncbi:uncharacterized protein A1O9_02884 [Exophiala aquamarina CBS 119918]|uniref:Uncharacterized protein n=1 Tax=Exophiala aquamarina CBS 119918 TaxID=1182545 RepID=A0A072PMN5_9EURO|nr:uncharacterized protein A1O9_02884 [Exophiala aquamarina CBS 119918]KEF61319.1 hypothetical protein A1O9_02884 [Exophiala aquamarina CBS 119918]
MSIYPEIDDGDDSLPLNAQLSDQLSESDLSFFDGPEDYSQDNNPRFPAEATETLEAAILRLTGGRPRATVNGASGNAREPFQSSLVDPALEAAPTMDEASDSFGAMAPPRPLVFDTSASAITAPVPAQTRPPVYTSRAPRGADVPIPDKKLSRVADVADPPCCPLCFHMYTNATGVKYHLKQFHNKSTTEINANPDFQHPKTLGYFKAQGINTDYTGTVRKQVNARRRWEAGLTSDTQEYFNDVYKGAPAVRTARNRAAKRDAKNA